MKRILGGASVILAGLSTVVVLAAGLLGLALGFGWLLSRSLPFDLFQATLLGLVALGLSLAFVGRFAAAAFSYLASRSSARQPRQESSGAVEQGSLDVAGAGEGEGDGEPDAHRRRRHFDA